MSATTADAVDRALAYARGPAIAAAPQLPDDVLPLLRIAAGDRAEVSRAALATGESASDLREAASLFLQRVLFDDEQDSYRTLGVSPGASEAELREHHRWLVRWLHPDRNPDAWESSYLYRVNSAWQEVRGGHGRTAAVGTADHTDMPVVPAFDAQAFGARGARANGPLSPLPRTTFALLALAAASALAWLHVTRSLRVDAGPAVVREWPEHAESAPVDAAPAFASAAVVEPARRVGSDPPVTHAGPGSTTVAVSETSAVRAEIPGVSRNVGAPPTADAASDPGANRPRGPTRARTAAFDASTAASESGDAPIAGARTSERLEVAPTSTDSRIRSSASTSPLADSGPPPIDAAEAYALIRGFVHAYESGDLDALDALLTRVDAQSPERRAQLRQYGRVFGDTRARSLTIGAVSVVGSGNTGAAIGSFSARMARADGSQHLERGDVRFDLLRERGVLRIHQVRHETR